MLTMDFRSCSRSALLPSLIASALMLAAGMARADCAADFARDNQYKPAAGPYRWTSVVEVFAKKNGSLEPVRTEKSSTEFAPPLSMHGKVATATNSAEMILVEGKRAWMRQGAQGKLGEWKPMAKADFKGIVDKGFGTYLGLEDASKVRCLGEHAIDGKPFRVYVFEDTGDLGYRKSEAYFDAQTGLLTRANIQMETKDGITRTDGTIVHDRSISITPPVVSK